jgi:hypothetical protein
MADSCKQQQEKIEECEEDPVDTHQIPPHFLMNTEFVELVCGSVDA